MARYRAWRFGVADLDTAEKHTGFRLSATAGIDMVTDDAAVRQALLLLISTRPGERVMRPEYGCNLHRLLFSSNDGATAGLAIHYVRRAVERWEPRVEIQHIDAKRSPEAPTSLEVILEYRVRATHRVDRLRVAVPLTEEVTP